MIFSRIKKCTICEDEQITHQALLPDGWAILWDCPATLCDKCLTKWELEFGERPVIYLEGGVKNPTLFD